MPESRQKISDLYFLLLEGKSNALLSMFSGEPVINTPLRGEIKGTDLFERYIQEEQAWLLNHQVKPELLALTSTKERVVAEFVLYLQLNNTSIDLPVAVVADLEGDAVSAIRIYHTTWLLTGEHLVRPALLHLATNLEEPEIIERYMDGIARPDKEAVLALFTEDGYVREPSGSQYKHAGESGRRSFYDVALADGGIPLKHCTATFDGERFAVEYICDEWGREKFAPQAGMAVYELTDANQLLAVRIYDDVSPPSETP